MRIAIYARVSTVNHGQDAGMQTREMRQFTEARGWTFAGQRRWTARREVETIAP
jgi:DNA invertase Pin-like site-specific DNA recombinase